MVIARYNQNAKTKGQATPWRSITKKICIVCQQTGLISETLQKKIMLSWTVCSPFMARRTSPDPPSRGLPKQFSSNISPLGGSKKNMSPPNIIGSCLTRYIDHYIPLPPKSWALPFGDVRLKSESFSDLDPKI
jgi:hypothetical protein